MNKISKIVTIVLFFGLLLVLPIVTVISPKQTFSEIENKSLAKFPEFSIESVKNQNYMKGIEEFISDNFFARTDWIGIKTDAELLSGKKEIKGVYILDNRLVEKGETPNSVTVQKSIDAINNFSTKINRPVFVMIAPTAEGIYSEQLPANAPKFDQKAFIDYVYERINNKNIVSLDAYSALFPTRDEYIYYRNDHHWTTLGAYYAYASTIKKMGFPPVLLNKYDIEHASNDFKGTLYSKSLYNGIKADTLDFYHYSGGTAVTSVLVNNGIDTKEYNSMYFKDFLSKKDKYSAFLGTNQPLVTIKTNSTNGNKLLILKDSYAHCYVPFLTQHYSEITLVDLRYINIGLDQMVNIKDYNQILFLYNASTFATDDNIKKLNFVK